MTAFAPLRKSTQLLVLGLMRWQNFSQSAIAAFPFDIRNAAEQAAKKLAPLVDASYRYRLVDAQVLGFSVSIPSRIHFTKTKLPDPRLRGKRWLAIQCLSTRATDGYLRHKALEAIVNSREPAAIPFIVLLAGEYVVEIIDDMVLSLPTLDRVAYASFVRENRQLMQRLIPACANADSLGGFPRG